MYHLTGERDLIFSPLAQWLSTFFGVRHRWRKARITGLSSRKLGQRQQLQHHHCPSAAPSAPATCSSDATHTAPVHPGPGTALQEGRVGSGRHTPHLLDPQLIFSSTAYGVKARLPSFFEFGGTLIKKHCSACPPQAPLRNRGPPGPTHLCSQKMLFRVGPGKVVA